MNETHHVDETNSNHRVSWTKPVVFGCVVTTFALMYYFLGDQLTLASLATRERQLRDFGQQNPFAIYAIAFSVYVGVTGLSLPGAAVMTLVIGWYCGFVRGVVLVSFASTAGATLAFLLSRYLFREPIERKFGERLTTFNEALQKEGAVYLFTLRLIPAVPFFVINVVMGLTPMRVRTFWWVSQLGMLAGTCVYIYTGSAVPNLATLAEQGVRGILTPQLITAFVLLGIFPIAVRKVFAAVQGRKDAAKSQALGQPRES